VQGRTTGDKHERQERCRHDKHQIVIQMQTQVTTTMRVKHALPPVTATDAELAATLRGVAEQAGASAGSLAVRFLPDEPSHAEGIAGMKLERFYPRPIE
jgi:hypothetical protein